MKLILSLLTILTAASAMASAPCDSICAESPIGDITISASATGSYIIPTNAFLRDYDDNKAVITPDVRAGFSFSPSTRYGRLYKGVTQGIGVNWNAILPHSTLGYPVGVFLFQNVRLATWNKLSAEIGWDFGITMPWRHFDPETNPDNRAIGAPANALLGGNLSAVYRLDDRLALKAALTIRHYSCGNTYQPNSGVNSIGLKLGVVYTLRPADKSHRATAPLPGDFRPGMGYDVTVYGAPRRRISCDSSGERIILPGVFGVAGINFAPMYAIIRYLRAGVALDMQYDESANLSSHLVEGTYGDEVRFYRQSFSERFAVGLSFRAEITLPIFSINAGVGRNIIARGDSKAFYQSLALKAYIYRGAFIQIGYRLFNFKEPNNLMIGAGYTFGRR